MRRWLSLVVLSGLLGCGGAAARQARPTAAADLSHAIDAWDAGSSGREAVAVRLVDHPTRGAHASVSVRAQGRRPSPAGPRRVDVRFANADLPNALRLLAEVARVDLVVDEGVNGTLTANLRDIDPYAALVALAEAHGAHVSSSGDFVVVRRSDAQSSRDPSQPLRQ